MTENRSAQIIHRELRAKDNSALEPTGTNFLGDLIVFGLFVAIPVIMILIFK